MQIMSKKKLQRNLRSKIEFEGDSDGDEIEKKNITHKNTLDNQVLSIGIVGSSSSLLSFDQDEEEFQIKKSNKSRKMAKMHRRLQIQHRSPSPADKDSQSPDSSTSARYMSNQQKVRIEEADSSTGQILQPLIYSGKEAERLATEHDAKIEELNRVRDLISQGTIPDSHAIYAARKRRQAAREGGEFIPIDVAAEAPVADENRRLKNDRSRLIREEASDCSDEDDQILGISSKGRLGASLVDRNRQAEMERRERHDEFLAVEQGESDDEKDEEFEKWEQEQLKKAITAQQISDYQQEQQMSYFMQQQMSNMFAGASAVSYPASLPSTASVISKFAAESTIRTMAESHLFNAYEYASADATVEKEAVQPVDMDVEMEIIAEFNPEVVEEPLNRTNSAKSRGDLPKLGGGIGTPSSLADVRKKLSDSLHAARDSSRRLEMEIDEKADCLVENLMQLQQIEDILPSLETDLQFYQEMQAYFFDLLDCLNEKVPSIDRLHSAITNVYRERAHFFAHRRQQDVRDQFQTCSASVAGQPGVIRDADQMIRAAEREARRTRRRLAREKTIASLAHHEGLSSDDDEAPSRYAQFCTERQKICEESAGVFADVAEEFAAVDNVLKQFVCWSSTRDESYQQAFMNLFLPKLLAPLVRLEMVGWNPLDSNSNCAVPSALESCVWFKKLSRLCASEVSSASPSDASEFEEHPAVVCLPAVVEKVLCPMLTELVENVWDPMSASQSERLASTVRTWVKSYPTLSGDSKAVQSLLEALVTKAKKSLNDDLFIPIYAKNTLENKANGSQAFLDRQFWACVKLARNLQRLERVLSEGTLADLIVDGICNRYLVLGLQCVDAVSPSTLTKVRAVAQLLTELQLSRGADSLLRVLARMVDELQGDSVARECVRKELQRLKAE